MKKWWFPKERKTSLEAPLVYHRHLWWIARISTLCQILIFLCGAWSCCLWSRDIGPPETALSLSLCMTDEDYQGVSWIRCNSTDRTRQTAHVTNVTSNSLVMWQHKQWGFFYLQMCFVSLVTGQVLWMDQWVKPYRLNMNWPNWNKGACEVSGLQTLLCDT